MAAGLRWYLRRLARMSPAEIIHRIGEQAGKIRDARRVWSWDEFGKFPGPLQGLPGFDGCASARMRSEAERAIPQLRTRRFRLLNRDWPETGDWDCLWHLDPVTGKHWPGKGTFALRVSYREDAHMGDVKFVWELNRLQFLPVLALGDDWNLVSQVLDSWMAQNPPFDGVNWSSAIEAASRVISLAAVLALAEAPERAALDRKARAFLDAHLFWIARHPSLYSSANNHRLAECAAQLAIGLCAPGLPGAAELVTKSRREIEERVQNLFLPDGVGAEQSTTYASYALEWLAIAGIAAGASGRGFSEACRSRAGAAVRHLLWLMDDDARVPRIGDGDETRVLAFGGEPETRYTASVAALVARWLGDPHLMPPKWDLQLRDLLASERTLAPAQIPDGMRSFDEGGYTVWRRATPQGSLVGVFDHAPLGFLSIAAHGHADALAIWLSWGEDDVFVDAGTFLYHGGGEWRDRFRSTYLHNTLAIDGADQSRVAGPFNWSRHAQARIVARDGQSVTAEHCGYRRLFGIVHRRMVCFGAQSLVIEDRLLGRPAREGLRWKLGFMLQPGISVSLAGTEVQLTTPAGRRLRLVVESGAAEGWRLERAPFSPSFDKRLEADRLTLGGTVMGQSAPVAEFRIEFLQNA